VPRELFLNSRFPIFRDRECDDIRDSLNRFESIICGAMSGRAAPERDGLCHLVEVMDRDFTLCTAALLRLKRCLFESICRELKLSEFWDQTRMVLSLKSSQRSLSSVSRSVVTVWSPCTTPPFACPGAVDIASARSLPESRRFSASSPASTFCLAMRRSS
jgi:hypothetical protein